MTRISRPPAGTDEFEFRADVIKRELERVAEILAWKLRAGDVVLLSGDLGAGKSTFARALIRALLDDPAADVPSPTFSILQTYATPRLVVAHADLYRLSNAEEAMEAGVFDAALDGALIVEWPDRLGPAVPANRIEIDLADHGLSRGVRELRTMEVTGYGTAAARIERIGAIKDFLARPELEDWAPSAISFLQGDASARSYARLGGNGERTAVLMDAPRQPDGPAVYNGLPYSRIAHLAEDVRPFVAVGEGLRALGFSAPALYAHDMDRGLLLMEDLGDGVFGRLVAEGHDQRELWRAATDALIALRRRPLPTVLPLPDGTTHTLPRFDRAALEIEVSQVLDWFWPAVFGGVTPSADIAQAYRATWAPLFDAMMALPAGVFLRDYHSPNLIWLLEREGVAKVGIIDFQDALAEHWAYDLVSLLQDARLDVPEVLEAELFAHYVAEVRTFEPNFNAAEFARAYALFGAQRNARLIGQFVRLNARDGKPQYLPMIPRAWRHLERALRHPDLAGLARWFDLHIPETVRNQLIAP